MKQLRAAQGSGEVGLPRRPPDTAASTRSEPVRAQSAIGGSPGPCAQNFGDFASLFGQFDTFLMGRRTWESSGSMTGGQRTIVVSATLDPLTHPEVTVISENLESRVRALKGESGKDIWLFGGGVLFRSLLTAGLVDTVEPAVIPGLLGNGVPFLPPGPELRKQLTLSRHQIYPRTGIALLEYEVSVDQASGS
jgi:dihydrofolate reductase